MGSFNKTNREKRIVEWTKDGKENDTYVWEDDDVYWGYWSCVGGEDMFPPDVMFRSEDEAQAFGVLMARDEWHVGPVVIARMDVRDNFDVPK